MDFHAVLRSQYHATLAMLKQAVAKCPPELWNDPQDHNKFWHATYHALFYTHLYLSASEADFKPWDQHHEDYQFFGPKPWAPNELPKIGEPYTAAEILIYWQVCSNFVDIQLPTLDLKAPSGFRWLPFSKFELQMYNIRHLQQHVGELMERLGSRAGIDVDWVGSV